jgi:hypothetical protein
VGCQRLGEAELFAAGDERLSITEMLTRVICQAALVRPTSPVLHRAYLGDLVPVLGDPEWMP